MNRSPLPVATLPRLRWTLRPGWLLASPLGALSLTLLVPVMVLLI